MFPKLPPLRLLAATVLLAALSMPLTARASVPPIVTAEGVLSTVAGTPLTDGPHALTFRLYALAQGGVPVWQEGPVWLDVKGGHFVHELGSLVPLTSDTANQGQWVAVQVDGQAELPRSPWRSAPFALRAQVAESVDCVGCVKSTALDPLMLAGFAMLSDLTAYVKTADLTATLAPFAKLTDLASYALQSDLAAYVKSSELAATLALYAKLTDLVVFAKTADLAVYALKTDFAAYVKATDLATTLTLYMKIADMVGYAKSTDLAAYVKGADLAATLAGYVKPADLADYAKLADLAAYAKSADLTTLLAAYAKTADVNATLALYAKVADLTGYAKISDLLAYAKTVDLATYAKAADVATTLLAFAKLTDLAAYAKAANLAAIATSGSYVDLLDKPALAKVGTACGVGQAVTGLAADGTLQCATAGVTGGKCTTGQVVTEVKSDGTVVCGAVTATLPADGLSTVSNGLMTDVFLFTTASATAPKAIPDNDPFGIIDDITLADNGVATSLVVTISVTNSNISGLQVKLLDPTNASYMLYNQGSTGTSLSTSYPTPTATVSGDLTSWVGKNPKGKWRLQVIDTKAGPGGNDGQLNGWSIAVKALSMGQVQVKGNLIVDGSVTVGGKALPQVWTAANGTLAAGASLDLDTGLGDVPLLASAWVQVGTDWKLIVPNVAGSGCTVCGNGEYGDFKPLTSVTLSGTRIYRFRDVVIPAGVTVSSSGGPLTILASGTVSVAGTIAANGGDAYFDKGGTADTGGFAGGTADWSGSGGAGPGAGKWGSAGVSPTFTPYSGGGASFGTTGLSGSKPAGNAGVPYAASTSVGMAYGGSGGGAGGYSIQGSGYAGGGGGGGGGAVVIVAPKVVLQASGKIQAQGGGSACGPYPANNGAGGGSGSGGHVWLRAATVQLLGSISVAAGTVAACTIPGGIGGYGRITIDATTVSGSTTPAYESTDLSGLPGTDAGGFTLTTTNGIAHLANAGQTSRSVRLVVAR